MHVTMRERSDCGEIQFVCSCDDLEVAIAMAGTPWAKHRGSGIRHECLAWFVLFPMRISTWRPVGTGPRSIHRTISIND